MLPFFWYMLKVIICSGILFGYYWLFLRNKIFHQYNRFYLLTAMILSLLLPLLKINFWQPAADTNQAIRVLQAVSAGDEYMNNIVFTAKESNWSFEQLYPVIYMLVSLIFCSVMLRTLLLIRTLLKKYPVQQVEDFAFINTQDNSTPFSFLKYIFWNSSIDLGTTTGRQIFKHEVAHIQEKHTHDKLFVNSILIFCWCNPFFWLYRKELNMIHEFIADKKAVEDSDTSAFAAMILQAAYPKHRFELANNFFYSPIKRRLLMLTKNKNPRVNYLARIMVLPLAIMVFAAFTFKIKNKPNPVAKSTTFAEPAAFINPTGTLPDKEQLETAVIQAINKSDTNPKIKSIAIQDDGGKPLIEIESRKSNLLFVVDGVLQGKDFNLEQLMPNDIVSIDVIKNEAAIAKYGQPGKDGVISIRTKKQEITGVNPAKLKLESEIQELKLKENDLARIKNDLILEQKIRENEKQIYMEKRALAKIYDSAATIRLAGIQLDKLEKQKLEIAAYNEAKVAYSNKINEVVVQGYPLDKSKVLEKQKEYVRQNTIFLKTETSPAFTGGDEAWRKYLFANLKASMPVDEGWKAGKYTIIVKFIVHNDGTVSDVTTENYIGTKTAQHCISIITNAPRWQPAVQNGKKVNAYKKQPITFVIEEQ
ncbi:MAG: hypothetical protein JNM14_16165 [Ferruginibacter sp.]|nr:hypothetical protein [Ferruginibacter sp.]